MNNYVAPPRRRFIRLITLVVGFVILLLIFNSFRSSHDEVPKPLGAQPTEKTHFGESPVEHANHGEPANPNVPLPSSASISAQAAKSELNKKPSVHTERIEDAPAQSITTPAVNADYNSFGESGQAAEDVVEKPKQAAPIAPKPITPKVKAPTAPAPAADASSPLSPACAAYPKDASLVTIVKTGATEAFARLPTLLLTYLSCIPEGSMLIYSDMAQQIGPYEIRDALEPSASKTNSDFELYYEQKKLIANGGQIWELSGDAGSKAWKLDKHKNLNAAQGAWDSVPGRDWYLFTDADTYISWTGMFALLNRLKENTPDFVNTPLYVGSEVNSGSPHFNHGGSGYLLNTAAMKVLVGEDRVELREEYTQRATRECCGDAELAKTLLKKGIKPTNVRPVISGDNMKDIQFGPRNWCHPIATMHHVGPEEVQKYWEFENRRMLQTQVSTRRVVVPDRY